MIISSFYQGGQSLRSGARTCSLLRVINILPAKIQKLPVNPFIISYIEVHKYLRTCYPTYFRVAILLQPFPRLNLYSFLSINAHKVYMYRNHQQKQMQSHQLWTLTTFFWLNIFTPYFGKLLRYRYILTSRSLLLFCAVEKNHFF